MAVALVAGNSGQLPSLWIAENNILGDPGAVSRRRAKWRDESFQERAEEPLGTKSQRTISKRLCEYGLLIGQKKSLVLFCPIGEQQLSNHFRVFYTAIVVLPYLSCSFTKVMRARETFILTFPTGDERTNEAWKIVAVASSKTFPISTEKILFLTDHKVS